MAERIDAGEIVVRGCAFPVDRGYHVRHNVWVKVGADGTVTLGATSYAVAQAGEFVAFVPKPIGTPVTVGASVGLIELWKTMVPVRSPIAGTIIATNAAAIADTSLINRSPYRDGWLVRLQADDAARDIADLVKGSAIAPAFDDAMAIEGFDGASRQDGGDR
jgi:glycine cleavage system H protein